ncbi:undecaprenyldiphospho-muramoylpentapeptide beta-N-acetylglucosaminyltransferase [Mangrovimicrobium sediminis]|uniref:UDP-N-acetylglucosamine--N-acetylmuramyl-(pentapeptide) pyrophosphoryl-undecaprenol N-acetylglucosamine transferase n=2 Tax=Mangrovimicrobium sediminis TaxID=2562682 RepID=A0A4Z0M4B7_9GAMM|nr:undecaprenyldiphospho-muramoylpentapeptide beta-N-acetylglucosaminyltransferase [Haliea sp. SAOS-164]
MAGGTGGHVFPALAVATELRNRGLQVEWVGTRRGLEERVVPAAGFELHHLLVRGVRGKGLLNRVLGVFMLALASVQALWLVLRRAPDCVIGMGGYVAGPAGVAAWLCRRPLVIHEQNAVAGTTNRMLAPLARVVVAGFPRAFAGEREVQVLGNPLRAELLAAAAQVNYDYDGSRPLRLLVLGGSLGAQPINEILPTVLMRLRKRPQHAVELWHQTGEAHVQAVTDLYGKLLDEHVQVVPFIADMAQAYAWADVVLCRAGALTVAELAVMGRPAILVPLPHAIDDHQTGNARVLAECGGAMLLRQSEMSVDTLVKALRGYMENPERLARMAAAAREAARPQATAQVADIVEGLVHGA